MFNFIPFHFATNTAKALGVNASNTFGTLSLFLLLFFYEALARRDSIVEELGECPPEEEKDGKVLASFILCS